MTHKFHPTVDIYTIVLVYELLRGLNTVHESLVLPYCSTVLILSKNFHILSGFNVKEMGCH